MSVGIYNDPRPDHIACVSESGQMSQMVGRMDGQTDGRMQERPEWWTENRPEHWPEKGPEQNWLEERKWLEQGFP
jgi:hypothetical protein